MINKKLQVFVSSTYTDLIEERQAAVEAILDAGHIPAGMELFKAGKSQMKTIQKWIDESDVYMLMLGGRYGSIEKESGLSYTELEYGYALSKKMPVFAIVLDESFLYTKAASGKDEIFEKDNIDKYNLFKKSVESKIVKYVENIYQIPNVISVQLQEIILDDDYDVLGWVRSNKIKSMYNEEEKDDNNYSVSYVKTREEIDKSVNPLQNMFVNVRSLNIVTVSGVNLLQGESDKIINLLKENINIKIVVLKAGTKAYKDHFTYKLDSLQILKDSSEKTWESWMALCNKYDTLFLKYTDICIPFNILYVEKENKEESFIKVDIYSINAIARERPCLYIKPTDKMFDYFVEQFRLIWESKGSKKFVPSI